MAHILLLFSGKMTHTHHRSSEAQPDLLHALNQEHVRLERLFEDTMRAFQSNDREDAACLWTEFQTALETHLELEEEQIIPELAKYYPNEAAALLCEHKDIRSKVNELGIGVDLHFTRSDAVAKLVQALRAHAKRENALMYEWGQITLDPTIQEKILNETLGR